MIFRIAGWEATYENNRTKELKTLNWVPIPNRMDGDGYTELIDHKDGAAHLGAWIAIVQIASKCDPRGTLLRDGRRPHTSESLSRISRIPKKIFDEAIPRFISIGWLEQEKEQNEQLTLIPQDGAVIPQDGAASRAREEGNGREWKEQNGRELERVAVALHDRHPSNGCGKAEIRKKLTAILNKYPESKWCDVLSEIDQNHAAWCDTDNWRRGYAKGLANWLAPTEGRWQDPPPPEKPLIVGERHGPIARFEERQIVNEMMADEIERRIRNAQANR